MGDNKKTKIGFRFQVSGLTMVELLIIIVVIGIVLGTGIPFFLKNIQPDYVLSNVMRDLVGDLRRSQQTAITEQIYSGLVFSTSTLPHQYQIVRYGENEEIIEVISQKELPPEVSFEEISFTDKRVVFNPYGAAKEGGIVVLINAKNKTGTVDVRPSGFVKIIE